MKKTLLAGISAQPVLAAKLIVNRNPPGKKSPRVEVTGISDAQLKSVAQARYSARQWNRLLQVSVVAPDGSKPAADLPAMLGSYRGKRKKTVKMSVYRQPGFCENR